MIIDEVMEENEMQDDYDEEEEDCKQWRDGGAT